MNGSQATVRPLRFPLPWLAAACLGLAGGCGGGSGELSGKVMYQGKPVRMGWVFGAGNDGVVRSARIQDDGSYSLGEVPPGPVKLSVTSPDPSSSRPQAKKKMPKGSGPPADVDVGKWFAIPDQYGDFTRSELSVTVRRGSNHFDIELK
jgi:hypothetical protein